MSRTFKILLPIFILIALFAISFAPSSDAEAGKKNVPGYIVVFKDDGFRNGTLRYGSTLRSMESLYGVQVFNKYKHALKGFSANIPADKLAAIQADPRVAYVEPNMRAWSIQQSQTVPTGLHRSFAASNPALDIDGVDDLRVNVDVAVIDTGVYAHTDLVLAGHVNCAGGSPRKSSCKAGGTDGNGHGTHVAGTIGAKDNGFGVVGVAPGARIWGVRVLGNNGSGYTSWIIAGIDWVTANAATIEVANMSLGGQGTSSAYSTAINNSINKGVVYVVAAGNSDMDSAGYTPANVPNVITVSALADFNGAAGGGAAATCRADVDDTLADFSNWGSTVEIAAPGVCILSTWNNGGYDTISGTSMASPHVAGAAALLASRSNPNTKNDVLNIANTIINAGNFNWTDDSGDGRKEPLMDVSSSAFAPVMVAP